MNPENATVFVSYHHLPAYLKAEAVKTAKEVYHLSLRDLMKGRMEFGLSHRDPATERRTITMFQLIA